jgi:hypothetical protein
MEDFDMDKLVTAIVTAGLLAGHDKRSASKTGEHFLAVQKSLYDAGVIDTPTNPKAR